MDILSRLENITKLLQDSQSEKIKKDFNNSLGIDKEQYDSVRKLIDSFQDSEESIAQYEEQIKQCNDKLKKFDKSIEALTDNLNKTKKSEERKKVQDEIDKKKEEREHTARKKQRLEDSLEKETFAKNRTSSKFKRVTRGKDIAQGVAAATAQDKAVKGLAKGRAASLGKSLGGIRNNPYLVAVGLLVKAVEFGISKSTDYMRLNYENLLRQLNATTVVSLNAMKANMAAWQDSVTGAYEAQNMAISSQEAMLEAQNATELANLKMAHTWTNWIPIWGQINKYQETALEMEQQVAQTRLKNAHEMINMVNEFTRKTDEYIKKQEKAIRDFQTDRGLSTEQNNMLQNWMLKQGEIFAKFNRTIEDVLKMQSSFTEKSGRAVNFSENDNIQSIAVGRLVGDENIVNFQAQMQLFNHSVAESADIMYEMYKDVNKMGLSQKKVTKDVLANLKLANKYDFKNGTKGFIELAKWAENARFNLSSLGSMIEKVQGGGLEGTITQAAKLQVLGGNFARNADPLSMLYNAYADPESYAKQIQKMFKGIGRFNGETGETTFNIADNLRIRAAAEAIGMSTEDAKNMVREENKKNVVMGQMKYSTLTTRQKEAVANKAQRDERTGRWYVNMIGGGKVEVERVNAQNLDNIVSDNKDEAAVQYAKSTMSFVEKIEATTKQIDAKLGLLSFTNFAQLSEEQMNASIEAYSKFNSEVQKAIETNRKDASEANRGQLYNGLTNLSAKYANERSVVDLSKNEDKKDASYVLWREGEAKMGNTHAAYDRASERWMQAKKEYDESSGFDAIGKWYNKLSAKAAVNRSQYVDNWNNADGFWNKMGSVISTIFSPSLDEQAIQRQYELRKKYQNTILNPENFTDAQNNDDSSIAVPANKVIPIHDGITSIAKSDPKDSAIFAKAGGPFDTLFNGIFDKINKMYGLYSDAIGHKNVIPNVEVQPIPIANDKVSPTSINIDNSTTNTPNQTTKQISNTSNGKFDVNIHGEINLKANGQSINILNELQSNPILVRAITDMISDSISKKINGGRSIPNGYPW